LSGDRRFLALPEIELLDPAAIVWIKQFNGFEQRGVRAECYGVNAASGATVGEQAND
jgi:hypothetical protein